jgi:MFS family permease
MVPLAGILVDRYGPRRVVGAAETLQGVGFLGYLAVTTVPGLIGAAVLAAAGQRLFWSAYSALVSDMALPADRDRWFGLAGALQSAGLGLGGLAASALVARGGTAAYRLVVAGNGLSFLLAAGLILAIRRETHVPPPRDAGARALDGYRALLADRPFLGVIAANTIFALCSVLLGIGLPVYAVEALRAPGWAVGLLVALNTATLAGAQTLAVRLLASHRRTRALAFAGLLWTGWCLAMALALRMPHVLLVPYLVGTTALYTLAALVHAPTSNALAAAASPAARRGRYLAAFQLSFSLASIVAPVLFTALVVVWYALPWLVVGALALGAVLAILRIETVLPDAAVRRAGAPRTVAEEVPLARRPPRSR